MWGESSMEQSPLASVLGHLAQTAELQTQLQQVQNEVLVELARSLAADREAMRELLGSGKGGGVTRPGQQIFIPKMGKADDPEAFLGPSEGWPRSQSGRRRSGPTVSCLC